jgi:steroid delta-isomerase-like uncharacterized protein
MKKLQRGALAAVAAVAAVAGGLGVANAATSAQPTATNQYSQPAANANVCVVDAFIHEVVDGHDGSATGRLVTSDVSWHGGTLGDVSGSANVQGLFTSIVTALPDLHSTVYDVVAQGNEVVVRQVITGTQTGAIIGIPASGKTVSWNAVDLFVLRNGKISQIWAGDDWTAILYDTGTYTAPWIK